MIAQIEERRNVLLKKIAKKFCDDPSRFSQGKAIIEQAKFSISLILDLTSSFTVLGSTWNSTFEGVWTIFQYVVACCFVFSVVLYSSSGRCLTKDFLLIMLGLYNVEWKLRKNANDSIHRPRVKQYLNDNDNRNYERDDIWAMTCLALNEVVDANLGFVYSIAAETLMCIAKVHFLLIQDEELCAIRDFFRVLVILWGIVGPVKAIAKQEMATMLYLKIFNFFDAHDDGDLENFNYNLQNKVTHFATFGFHLLGFLYRISIISFYFQMHLWVGFLHLGFLLTSSLIQYKLWRPRYENPPVGAPTKIYTVLEIVCGVFTVRNHRISSCRCVRQSISWIRFVLVKSFEHFGFLFFFYFIINLFYPNVNFQPHNETDCKNAVYRTIASVFTIFSPEFNTSDSYLEVLLKNMPLLALFIAYHIYSLFYFAYLHFSGLNDDRFPAHASIHIYGEKLINRRMEWSKATDDWMVKMFMYTLNPRLIFVKLPNDNAITSNKWLELINKELEGVFIPPIVETAKAQTSCLTNTNRDHSMRSDLSPLIEYCYSDLNCQRIKRGLVFKFCIEFENRMRDMDSYKLACICQKLGTSPIVKSDFTDDPIADSFFWFFK